MPAFTYRHRVRYRECDPMGVVYHTHYLDYFEAARTEALRDMGLAYAKVEESGVTMPVTEVSIRYHAPARYDQILVIQSSFAAAVPKSKVRIEYEVRLDDTGTLVATGSVTLCFFDTARQRPVRAPDFVRAVFEKAVAHT